MRIGTLTALGLLALSPFYSTEVLAQASSLPGVVRAKNLIGDQVRLEAGRQIGKVDDVVVDLTTGRMLYAVVDTEDHRIAIPPGTFTRASGDTLRVQGDRQTFRNAPKYTRQVGQELAKASFVHQVYQHFGQTIWWEGSSRPADQGSFENVHKVSDLIDSKIKDVNGQSVATVNNLALDLETGRVLYVYLEPDSQLKLDKGVYPVPPDALTRGSDDKSLTANLTREKLSSAPSIEERKWTDSTTVSFASRVYEHFGKQPWFNNERLTPTGRAADSPSTVTPKKDDEASPTNRVSEASDDSENAEAWERRNPAGWGRPSKDD